MVRFRLKCSACGETFTVRGTYESDTNATVFSDDDPGWDDACEHVRAGADYTVDDWDYDDYDDDRW